MGGFIERNFLRAPAYKWGNVSLLQLNAIFAFATAENQTTKTAQGRTENLEVVKVFETATLLRTDRRDFSSRAGDQIPNPSPDTYAQAIHV